MERYHVYDGNGELVATVTAESHRDAYHKYLRIEAELSYRSESNAPRNPESCER